MYTPEKMSNRFELDTNDVLGLNYSAYVDNMRALALTKPGDYFTLRQQVQKKVKEDAVAQVYKTVFNILTLGANLKNQPIGLLGEAPYIPGYPSQKVNDIAIQGARIMAEYLDSVCNIILPGDFTTLASSKMSLKGRANVIE